MKSPEESDQLFEAGKFDEADVGYAHILVSDPNNLHALRQHAYIALLSNRLASAKTLLTRVLQLNPADMDSKGRLAETFARLNDFARAAPLLRQAGDEAKAKQFEGLKNTPYDIRGPETTRVHFLATDPLPIIDVSVDGNPLVPFFVDTGATLYVSPTLASKLGISDVATFQGTFAGGLKAMVHLGKLDVLTIGDVSIRNVPIGWLDTPGLELETPDGRLTQGVIGTTVLYHFLSTLDYANGLLVLREKSTQQLKKFEDEVKTASAFNIPFWMAGDHYMVAEGTVNGHGPMLLLVDTGLAGAGFAPADSTVQEVGILLDQSRAISGVGGGGAVHAVPFVVDELTLGPVVRRDIRGFAGVYPDLNFGFRVGGIISHQFFRPFEVTFDFTRMRLFIVGRSSDASC